MSVAVNHVPIVWAGGPRQLDVSQLPSWDSSPRGHSSHDGTTSTSYLPYFPHINPSQFQQTPSSSARTTSPCVQYSRPDTQIQGSSLSESPPRHPAVWQTSTPTRPGQKNPSGTVDQSPTMSTALPYPNPDWLGREIKFTYTPPPSSEFTAPTDESASVESATSITPSPVAIATPSQVPAPAAAQHAVTAVSTTASASDTGPSLIELSAPPVQSPAATSVSAIPISTPPSSVTVQDVEPVMSRSVTPTPPSEAPVSEIATSAGLVETPTSTLPDQRMLQEALMKALAAQYPQGLPQAELSTQPADSTFSPAEYPEHRVSQTTQVATPEPQEVGVYPEDYPYRSPIRNTFSEEDETAAWQDTAGPEIRYAERSPSWPPPHHDSRGHQKSRRMRSYDVEGDEDEWSDDSIGTMVGRTVRSWGTNALCAGKAFLSAVLAPEERLRHSRHPYGDRDLRRRRSSDFQSAYPPREDPMIYHDHYTHSDSGVDYGRPPLPVSDWESERSWESGVSSASTGSGSKMSRAERKAMKRAEKARRKAEKKQRKLEREMSRSGSGSESRWYRRSGSSRKGSI